MELSFSTEKAKTGRALLDTVTPPNCIRSVDFAYKSGNNTVVERLMLEFTKNDKFKITVLRYNVPRAPRPIIKMSHKTFDDNWKATQAFEELESGFEHNIIEYTKIGRSQTPIVSLFKSGFYTHRFTGTNNIKELPTGNCVSQKVTGGIHSYLKISEHGEIALHEINHLNASLDEQNIITANLRCYADMLVKEKGFRSALIEGFASDKGFEIVDVAYIGNTDLRALPLEERLEQIPALLGDYASKYGVSFSGPCATENPGANYIIVRDRASGFSATSRTINTNYLVSRLNILSLDVIENNNGTVQCYYSDNESLSYSFKYLSQDMYLALESYFLSESTIGSPILF